MCTLLKSEDEETQVQLVGYCNCVTALSTVIVLHATLQKNIFQSDEKNC